MPGGQWLVVIDTKSVGAVITITGKGTPLPPAFINQATMSTFNSGDGGGITGPGVTLPSSGQGAPWRVLNIPERDLMDFEFYKLGMLSDGVKGPLKDVEFELYDCTKLEEAGHVHDELVASGSCWDVSANATSAIDGKVSFTGLISGDYMLVETKTVEGYQLPMGQWKVSLDTSQPSDYTIIGKGNPLPPAFYKEDGTYRLLNYQKMEVPLTGGIGTILLTILGIAMIGGAIMGLFYNKLYNKQERGG